MQKKEIIVHILEEMRSMCQLVEAHIDETEKVVNGSREEKNRDIVMRRAWTLLNTYYSWGGDDPSGIDCSGLMCELLQSVGIIGRKEDLTAQMLYNRFKSKKVDSPYRGCLVFWHSGTDLQRIIHVEICIDEDCAIGASGGGSRTLTKEQAIKDNAFVKIRTWRSRSRVYGFVDPFLR
ncbi:hypothetical protein LCGC14_2511750 [marine sediment metagenome]|uniref:NlpC/P60 domain-containing protein n=1 Tax=marine sediment metagenome TaxID=412755 RepID=A0A0F9DAQ1_9ZZZZ